MSFNGVLSIQELLGVPYGWEAKIQYQAIGEYQELVGFGAPIRIEKRVEGFSFYVIDRIGNMIEGTRKNYSYKKYNYKEFFGNGNGF